MFITLSLVLYLLVPRIILILCLNEWACAMMWSVQIGLKSQMLSLLLIINILWILFFAVIVPLNLLLITIIQIHFGQTTRVFIYLWFKWKLNWIFYLVSRIVEIRHRLRRITLEYTTSWIVIRASIRTTSLVRILLINPRGIHRRLKWWLRFSHKKLLVIYFSLLINLIFTMHTYIFEFTMNVQDLLLRKRKILSTY